FPVGTWKPEPAEGHVIITRRTFVLAASASLVAGAAAQAQDKADKIKVVATFSILADLLANVGGDRVDIATLVGANGDAHVYQPSPADAKRLADAKVVFTNGLGFEGWIARLIKASGTKAPVVVATKGVKPRRMESADAHGHSSDPHAWQAVPNVKTYVA